MFTFVLGVRGWVTGTTHSYSHVLCETAAGAGGPDTVSAHPTLFFFMKTYILLTALFSKAHIPFIRIKVWKLIHAMVIPGKLILNLDFKKHKIVESIIVTHVKALGFCTL